MAYEIQSFQNGEILTAEQLNHIEAGITALEKTVEDNRTAAEEALAGLHLVTFLNADGTVLATALVQDGEAADAPDDPELESGSLDYVLAFSGWDTNYSAVTEDLTVTAVYTTEERVHVSDGEIQDSWAIIAQVCEAGLQAEYYTAGDKKELDLGDTWGTVNMEIVELDTEALSDGSGTAPLTFVSEELLTSIVQWNTTSLSTDDDGAYVEGTGAIGGWASSYLRTVLQETILGQIPAEVRENIARVNNSHRSRDTSGTQVTQTTDDYLWVPSRTQVQTWYSDAAEATEDEARIKYRSGSAGTWWTRDSGSTTAAYVVGPTGALVYTSATDAKCIALGFCYGKTEKSAYDYAVDSGYTGTEAEFQAALAALITG